MPTKAKAGKRTKPKSKTTAKKKTATKRRKKPVPISLPQKRRPKTEMAKRDARVRAVREKIKTETKAKLALEYDCTLSSAEMFSVITSLDHLGRARTPTETRLLKRLRATKGRKAGEAFSPKPIEKPKAKGVSVNGTDPLRRTKREVRETMATLEKIASRRPREENAGRMFYKVRRDAQETIDSINDKR